MVVEDIRSIKGRVAIVTGAASGMGKATAELLTAQGALVAACDVQESIADVATTSAHQVDLTDPGAIEAFVTEVRDQLGPIDILVNNAGVSTFAPIESDEFLDEWERTFDINLTAPMQLIRACVSDLGRNGDGRIVNIASTEGLGGSANASPYTASKHGVIGLTKSLAIELGRRGVTVNAICPGPIHTGMTSLIPDEAKATFAHRRTALRRYGNPEEVAHMTLSLVLPAASYVTGVALPVDGGMTARNN